jgi:hypothetical protein
MTFTAATRHQMLKIPKRQLFQQHKRNPPMMLIPLVSSPPPPQIILPMSSSNPSILEQALFFGWSLGTWSLGTSICYIATLFKRRFLCVFEPCHASPIITDIASPGAMESVLRCAVSKSENLLGARNCGTHRQSTIELPFAERARCVCRPAAPAGVNREIFFVFGVRDLLTIR